MIFEHYVIIFLVLWLLIKSLFNVKDLLQTLDTTTTRVNDYIEGLNQNYRDKYLKEQEQCRDLLRTISDLEYKLEQSNDKKVKYYKDVLTKLLNEDGVYDLNRIITNDNAKETLAQVIGNKKIIIQEALKKY